MSESSIIYQTFSFLLVGIFWGLTNPFIKEGTKILNTTKLEENNKSGNFITNNIKKYSALICNWKFTLPLILNLMGSSVYYFMLGESEISLSIPITNAITLCFTLIGDCLISRKNLIDLRTGLGILLIILGITICSISKL